MTTHRFLDATIVHPWTNTPVGQGYLADQNPFDTTTTVLRGSRWLGSTELHEDDDNDGRIDQFKWPCDFDGDGVRITSMQMMMATASMTCSMLTPMTETTPVSWQARRPCTTRCFVTFNDYRVASHGLTAASNGPESMRMTPMGRILGNTCVQFRDRWIRGDLANFIDPDQDGDGTLSADNDDDNDGLLDMYDPDDDNDGIPDAYELDTNGDDISDMTGVNTTPYQTPGGDTDGVAGTDCEIDYDGDLDNDRWRPFDQNYNGIWDWLDSDLGGTTTPDTPPNTQFDPTDFPWDIDDDQIENEVDAFPLNSSTEVATWNCPTLNNPNPVSPDQRCNTGASYAGFNDWDDGISNWDDIDDDNDGIIDPIYIDPDCDPTMMAVASNQRCAISRRRTHDVDSDADGDGLENDIDWDEDVDGMLTSSIPMMGTVGRSTSTSRMRSPAPGIRLETVRPSTVAPISRPTPRTAATIGTWSSC